MFWFQTKFFHIQWPNSCFWAKFHHISSHLGKFQKFRPIYQSGPKFKRACANLVMREELYIISMWENAEWKHYHIQDQCSAQIGSNSKTVHKFFHQWPNSCFWAKFHDILSHLGKFQKFRANIPKWEKIKHCGQH